MAGRAGRDGLAMTGLGFPADARLRKGADFESCFAARQRLSGRFFLFHWKPNGLAHARLGLAVSRRVDRRAVVRNRIKRQVRECFRLCSARLPAVDLVASARPGAARAERGALREDLLALLRKLAALPLPAAQGTMRADPGADGAKASDPPTAPTY